MFFQKPSDQAHRITTVQAPIGGLNVRDSLSAMPESDAIVLNNWWPQPYGLTMRHGYQEWSTGLGDTVSTLATWVSVNGTEKLLAWAGEDVYDASTRGTIGAPIVTGLNSAFWCSTSIVNSAGSHLIAVNGLDNGICYDESGIHRLTAGDGVTAYTWAVLDPKDATHLTVHQHRLWAVKINSAIAYYLPTDAIYGTWNAFDFGASFSRGGYILYVATWTINDYSGTRDLFVAVSSEGQVVVYSGTDPDNASTWALTGIFYVGAPVAGMRSFCKVGGDLFILTQQGIVSLADLLNASKAKDVDSAFKSNKIQFLISELVSTYADLSYWQLIYVPKINMLICNVPTLVDGGNMQIASNQIIDAWTQFSNMDAAVWCTYNSNLYFGDFKGRVLLAWEGNVDNVPLSGDGGTSITAVVQQAYSYMGSLGTQKQVGMYRPNLVVASPVIYNTAIQYDFEVSAIAPPDSVAIQTGNVWDSAIWGIDTWYGGTSNQRTWSQANGLGVAASICISLRANGEVLWVSTDYSHIQGGLL